MTEEDIRELCASLRIPPICQSTVTLRRRVKDDLVGSLESQGLTSLKWLSLPKDLILHKRDS